MAKAKKLDSGSWRVRVYIGLDANGTKKYVSITKPTEKEANLSALELQLNAQMMNDRPQELTFSTAIDKYIELKENVLSPTTIAGYKTIKRNHLQILSNVKLSSLTRELIQKAVNLDSATHSPKTVRNAHGLLSAVLDEYYPTFVLKTKLPSKVKYIPEIPNADNITKLIELSKGTDVELPILLGLWLGLRMSEIKGLKFEDLRGNLLHIKRAMVKVECQEIVKQTKTYSSTRSIVIPDYIVELINNTDQNNEYIIKLSGQAIYKRLVRLCEKNGLPHYRFHDLRHANASIMLALGIPDKYAMERMGHATNNMLKNVYQHTMSDEKIKTNDMVNDYFNKLMK